MTIHFRLTLLFTVAVSLLLIIFATLVYERVATEREKKFYEQLELRALTAAIIALEEDELPKSDIIKAQEKMKIKLPYEQIIIIDSLNTSVYESPNFIFELDSLIVDMAREEQKLEILEKDTQSVYIQYFDNDQFFTIYARAYDSTGFELLSDIALILVAGLLFSPIVIFITGWWFAKNMLKPIEILNQSASKYSAVSLHKRLPLPNDSEDEISRLAMTINSMLDRIEHAFLNQKQFVSQASHELRTPLAILMGEIDVTLRKERTPPEYQDILTSMRETVSSLARLSDNLLILVKADDAISPLVMKEEYLDEIVYAAIEDIRIKYPTKKIEINIDEMLNLDEPPKIYGNYELLKVTIRNIVENGIKYSADESSIIVNIFLEANYVCVDVIDTGIGMKPDELNRIFEPLYRSDNVRNVSGHGIGLAIVYAVVNKHDAQIFVQSKPNEGSIFTLKIKSLS